jgi:hypothetical protein
MKAVVQRVIKALPLTPVTIVEIDISTDRALDERYGTEIPVLLIEGKKVAKYRIGEDDLRQVLLARDRDGKTGQAG